MAPSIREVYDICKNTGGFSTVIRCVNTLRAVLHRAGNDSEDYTLNLTPSLQSGDTYTFSLPYAVFGYPVGYYDVDLYDGDLFKRTIRLNLHTSSVAGVTQVVETDCVEGRDVAPNTTVVVECSTAACAVPCPIPCTVSVDRIDRCSLKIGYTFTPIVTQSEEEARMARIAHAQVLANIRQTPTVEFVQEEPTLSIPDYFEQIVDEFLGEGEGEG